MACLLARDECQGGKQDNQWLCERDKPFHGRSIGVILPSVKRAVWQLLRGLLGGGFPGFTVMSKGHRHKIFQGRDSGFVVRVGAQELGFTVVMIDVVAIE